MSDTQKFIDVVKSGYTFKGESYKIGSAMLDGGVVDGADVLIPLRTMNRHGLIAGATGTGKTKTLQVLAEGLSDASVPVLLMDINDYRAGSHIAYHFFRYYHGCSACLRTKCTYGYFTSF